MRKTAAIAAGILAVSALAIGLRAADTRTTQPTTSSVETPAQAGYRVYIDPVTGQLTAPPQGDPTQQYPKSVQDALSRSSEDLFEVPAPVGGGKMVDLRHRFQNTYTATTDADGKLVIECDDEPSTNTEKE